MQKFDLKMIAWRNLPIWLLRAWPVWALLPVFIAHSFAIHQFTAHPATVHKLIGMSLQVLGGLLILFSVNENLGVFRKQSLGSVIVSWFREFPIVRTHILGAGNTSQASSSSGSGLTIGRERPATIDGRVAELELQLQEVREEMRSKHVRIISRIDAVNEALSKSVIDADVKLTSLSERIEQATVGGFKLQAFGVLLAVYGAITSVFA